MYINQNSRHRQANILREQSPADSNLCVQEIPMSSMKQKLDGAQTHGPGMDAREKTMLERFPLVMEGVKMI